MPFLEQIWDLLGVIFGGLFGKFERAVTAVFGSANARQVTRLQKRVDAINELESKYQPMTDEELRGCAMVRRWTIFWKMRSRFAAREVSAF